MRRFDDSTPTLASNGHIGTRTDIAKGIGDEPDVHRSKLFTLDSAKLLKDAGRVGRLSQLPAELGRITNQPPPSAATTSDRAHSRCASVKRPDLRECVGVATPLDRQDGLNLACVGDRQ